MSALFIPTLSHWQLGNRWSGSLGRASYYVTPRTREEGEEKIPELLAEVWTGPLCYELSQAEDSHVFPVTQAGLEEMAAWLEERLSQLDRLAKSQAT